jgi:hypothetical protein
LRAASAPDPMTTDKFALSDARDAFPGSARLSQSAWRTGSAQAPLAGGELEEELNASLKQEARRRMQARLAALTELQDGPCTAAAAAPGLASALGTSAARGWLADTPERPAAAAGLSTTASTAAGFSPLTLSHLFRRQPGDSPAGAAGGGIAVWRGAAARRGAPAPDAPPDGAAAARTSEEAEGSCTAAGHGAVSDPVPPPRAHAAAPGERHPAPAEGVARPERAPPPAAASS